MGFWAALNARVRPNNAKQVDRRFGTFASIHFECMQVYTKELISQQSSSPLGVLAFKTMWSLKVWNVWGFLPPSTLSFTASQATADSVTSLLKLVKSAPASARPVTRSHGGIARIGWSRAKEGRSAKRCQGNP